MASSDTLSFTLTEGLIRNFFFRRGPVAAHLLVTSGTQPRILCAFPAGSTGACIWFAPSQDPIDITVEGQLLPIERDDGMRGIRAVVCVSTQTLHVDRVVMGGIRTIRDCLTRAPRADEISDHSLKAGPPLVLRRTLTDRTHHVEITLDPMNDAEVFTDHQDRICVNSEAHKNTELRFQITILTDYPPLTPIASHELVNSPVGSTGERELQALAFLSYREKLLAGSWRFPYYFGRDTLLSTRLLMPVLQPDVIEAALGSVLDRINQYGEVAHEEDIGDYIALQKVRTDPSAIDLGAAEYDYKMVDDDLLLAPILTHYLLDTPMGRNRAASFLARRTLSGLSYADALRQNLVFVLRRATPYAKSPSATTLVSIRNDIPVGQWRDSFEGLGGGVFAFDVNAALVPAALHAAERLYQTELLGSDQAIAAAQAHQLAHAWRGVENLFRVEVPVEEAKTHVLAIAQERHLDAEPALASIKSPLVFSALSLDTSGTPIPIMHTDSGFVLLFCNPSPEFLDSTAQCLMMPFPAGLQTPVGILVANPTYVSDPLLRATFTPSHYHGTVVWSWQQALLAAGLARQLERDDLPAQTIEALRQAQSSLWQRIEATQSMRLSELWSFAIEEKGVYKLIPFGQGREDVDESNAVQLWSTVYLAVKPPR